MVVRRYQDFVEAFRKAKDMLQLTNEFCDLAGGLVKGHTDKILGPSEIKRWGPTTFDLFCEMFAIEFRVHVDPAAAGRMQKIWEARERKAYSPDAKIGQISRKLVERAKPLVLQASGKAGGTARAIMLSPKHRSDIARKAAKSRWRKHRKALRDARAKPAGTTTPSLPAAPA
jgi:hypothetical protein